MGLHLCLLLVIHKRGIYSEDREFLFYQCVGWVELAKPNSFYIKTVGFRELNPTLRVISKALIIYKIFNPLNLTHNILKNWRFTKKHF